MVVVLCVVFRGDNLVRATGRLWLLSVRGQQLSGHRCLHGLDRLRSARLVPYNTHGA